MAPRVTILMSPPALGHADGGATRARISGSLTYSFVSFSDPLSSLRCNVGPKFSLGPTLRFCACHWWDAVPLVWPRLAIRGPQASSQSLRQGPLIFSHYFYYITIIYYLEV